MKTVHAVLNILHTIITGIIILAVSAVLTFGYPLVLGYFIAKFFM